MSCGSKHAWRSHRRGQHAAADARTSERASACADTRTRTRRSTHARAHTNTRCVGGGRCGRGMDRCAALCRAGEGRSAVCARSLCAWPCVRPPYLGIGATCRCVRSEENELGSFMDVMRGRIAPNAWSVPRGVVGSAGSLRRTDTQARLRRTSIATSRSWSRARPSHGASLRAPHCVATSRMGGWLQPPKQP